MLVCSEYLHKIYSVFNAAIKTKVTYKVHVTIYLKSRKRFNSFSQVTGTRYKRAPDSAIASAKASIKRTGLSGKIVSSRDEKDI